MTRPTLAVAIALPVLLAATALVIALVTSRSQPPASEEPLALPAVPAPAAESAECRSLLDRLPGALTSAGTALPRRTLAAPEPPGTAAWGIDGQPAVLRCGIERPAELTRTATLLDVSGVRWLRLPGTGASTWVAVDRPVYVGLTVGDEIGTGPLQEVSTVIAGTLPTRPVEPGT